MGSHERQLISALHLISFLGSTTASPGARPLRGWTTTQQAVPDLGIANGRSRAAGPVRGVAGVPKLFLFETPLLCWARHVRPDCPLAAYLAAKGILVRLTCRLLGRCNQACFGRVRQPVCCRDRDSDYVTNDLINPQGDDLELGYRLLSGKLARLGYTVGERSV
jgi:hypothetical protein